MILAITEDAYKRRRQTGAGPAPLMLFRDDEGARYQVRGRTAVLHFDGVVGRGFSWWWGSMADPADLVAAVRQAEADPEIDDVLLIVDSPGGECVGVHEAHLALRGCSKRTRAHVVGLCASAGYWIASAADEVTASPTAAIGCIGAIVEGCDDTEALESFGYRFKVLRSSRTPDKAPDVGDDRWDAEMQPLLDEIGDRFLADIGGARGWGDDLDAIAARVEAGRLFPPKAALAAGLIDQITTDEIIGAGGVPSETPQTEPGATRSHRKEPVAMADEKGKTENDDAVEEMEKKVAEAEAERDAALQRVAELEAEVTTLEEKIEGKASEDEALVAQLRLEVATRHAETALQSGRIVPKERDGFINALSPFVDDGIRAANGWEALCQAASAAGAEIWASCFGVRARGESWATGGKTHGAAPDEGAEKPNATATTLAERITALKAEGKSHGEAIEWLRLNEPELLST